MKLISVLLVCSAGLSAGTAVSAKSVAWQPIPAGDFAQTQLASDPDAPALILDWRLDVDDREYPDRRDIQEVIRYKIFDPEKSVPLTRLSELIQSFDDRAANSVEISARVVLPSGQTKEFGADAIQERSLQKTAAELNWAQRIFGGEGQAIREKFLAVSGLEPGCILEVRVNRTIRIVPPSFIYILQKTGVPIRHVRFYDRVSEDSNMAPRLFLVNGAQLPINFSPDLKKGSIFAEASNVPGLVDEPFSAPLLERSVSVCGSYYRHNSTYLSAHNSQLTLNVTAGDGPWAIFANQKFFNQEEAAYPQGAADRQAKMLTAGATNQTEKAARIHKYVQDLWKRFEHSPRNQRPPSFQLWAPVDHVMAFERYPKDGMFGDNFLWLEVALDRAAGLEAQGVLLADQRHLHFSAKLVSDMFLPISAVRVKADGKQYFSYSVTSETLPFGKLPWYLQGEPALLAKAGKQEFVQTPVWLAADSTTRNSGKFTLGTDGSLMGEASQTLTGQPAMLLRASLRRGNTARRTRGLSSRFKQLFPTGEITIGSVEGLDQDDGPLVIKYSVAIGDYSVATSKRIIFKPSLFHGNLPTPFPATTRRNLIAFPYHWREVDDFDLMLPAGYAFESPAAPQSMPGKTLNYEVGIGYSGARNFIRFTRDFSSELSLVPASRYSDLKRWYDLVAQSDQHELVLLKKTPSQAPAKASPTPDSAGSQ